MNKTKQFVSKYKVSISICVLILTCGFGYWLWAAVPTQTSIGDDIIVKGNVGIGTTIPGAKLEVAGQIKITGGSPGAGKVLTSDDSGLASWQTPTSGIKVYLNSATGKSCYAICQENSASCIGVGTDINGVNGNIWFYTAGSCTEYENWGHDGCITQTYVEGHDCSGLPAAWTYCRCIK